MSNAVSSNLVSSVEFLVPGVEIAIARWVYAGEAADTIRRLKYSRSTSVVGPLAEELCAIAPPCDLVSWIPATPDRRRRRGFDQSELLARAVARRLHLRPALLLRRLDHRAQTSRDRAGRLEGPQFEIARKPPVAATRVLLIDDVSTTGSTLAAAASILTESVPIRVSAAVVAKVVSKAATHGAICRSNM